MIDGKPSIDKVYASLPFGNEGDYDRSTRSLEKYDELRRSIYDFFKHNKGISPSDLHYVVSSESHDLVLNEVLDIS